MKQPPRIFVATSATLSAVTVSRPARPGQACAPVQLPDSLVTFWDELFCAVRSRLRQTVDASSCRPAAGKGIEDAPAEVQRMRDGVLDCVAALDQLHAALRHEAGRSRRLEQALVHAHAELDRVRAELAGSQADPQAGLPRPRSVVPLDAAATAARPGLFRVPATVAPEPADAPVVAPGQCLPSAYLLLHGGTGR